MCLRMFGEHFLHHREISTTATHHEVKILAHIQKKACPFFPSSWTFASVFEQEVFFSFFLFF